MNKTSVAESSVLSAEQLAIAISGDAPVTDAVRAIAKTIEKSLAAYEIEGRNRACSSCRHLMHTRNSSQKCGHPLIAAHMHDASTGRSGTADVTCYSQRENIDAKAGRTACSEQGNLHEEAAVPVAFNRIAAHFRALKANLGNL